MARASLPIRDLPAELFQDPGLSSLRTAQSHFAQSGRHFLRYRPEIAPFASLTGDPIAALAELASVMLPSETTFLIAGDPSPIPASHPALHLSSPSAVTQMLFPPHAPLPALNPAIPLESLTCANASAMVALTDAAFPGFFRPRTCEMGPYYGVRRDHQVVAMGGDRMVLTSPIGEAFHEVSGICTLAEHRGHGYAQAILARILHDHRTAGYTSFLHATSTNTGAISLYEKLGFITTREIWVTRLRRLPA